MQLNRRALLLGAGAARISTLASEYLPDSQHVKRPNVLLIFMDDQTHRSIRCLNNDEVHTPNLDRLAKRGTVFTHAFNQGAWSGAVCIPSRAMLLSGLTVWHSQHQFDNVPLWGEWFSKHGYSTFMTGKWHNGEPALKRCFAEIGPNAGGFLPSLPDTPEAQNDAYYRPANSNHWRPDDTSRGGHWMNVDGHIIHSSERWASAAIDFISRQSTIQQSVGHEGAITSGTHEPFFMHVAFHAPHDPRQAPTEFLEMYPRDKISIPPNFQAVHPFDQGDSRVRDELLTPFPRTEEAVRLHRQEYYAILSHADQQIGRILDALDATGLSKDTIVLFSGDHGLAVGQHGLMGKQNLYDHSVRIPLIMAGPGIPQGKTTDELVYQSGLFPTACDLCGLPTPKTVEHRSMVSLLHPHKGSGYRQIYGGYMHLQRMVCDHEWKLILYPKVGVTQLFHVANDPWEVHNLAIDGKYAGIIEKYTAHLKRLQNELDDDLALN